MTYELHRHDARHISTLLEPGSVDLIVTSPPYFALRSYRDGGEHYDGQLGSEPTPGEFIDALIACTVDWLRVLKPSGSLWVNLGDKYSQRTQTHRSSHQPGIFPGKFEEFSETWAERAKAGAVRMPHQNIPGPGLRHIPEKSLMGLPWRYAIRCIDELGLILRAEVIWSKPNGLPESVTDRVRRSHEQWFHMVREPRYFAAIDEVREPHIHSANGATFGGSKAIASVDLVGSSERRQGHNTYDTLNPLGKAPGSVWSIPSEPLVVPDHLDVDHFAAFPSELPRRIILGWSPSGYCTACGEPRRAVVDKTFTPTQGPAVVNRYLDGETAHLHNWAGNKGVTGRDEVTITGYVCACPDTTAPTTPAVVLDPFAGTGTVPAVAHLLGRHGIGTDLSNDYLRLAEWRCSSDRRLRDKVLDRTGIPNPDPPKVDGQLGLFEEGVA